MSTLHKDEPVLAGGFYFGVAAAIVTWLVAHGVIGGADATTNTQELASGIALIGPTVAAAILRRFTSPAKKVEDALVRSGLVSEADVANIVESVTERLQLLLSGEQVEHLTGADHPDYAAVGTPADQAFLDDGAYRPGAGGMGAGAPA